MNAAIVEMLRRLGLEPWPDGRSISDGKRPEEQHVMMIVSSLKAERDSLKLQNNQYRMALEEIVACQDDAALAIAKAALIEKRNHEVTLTKAKESR